MQLKIIIDTREQTPWDWPPEMAATTRGTLKQGDYALAGDSRFAIERKSLDDFAATMASGWARFERELMRMQDAGFVARVIIVESSMDDLIYHRYNSPKVLPPFLLKRVAELTLMQVTVLFGGSPEACIGLSFAIFRQRQAELDGGK